MLKIFVLCPYNSVTGGPDALHQLVYYLNRNGYNANIVYSDIHSYKHSIPEPYRVYINDYLLIKDIQDTKEAAMIIPETLTCFLDQFKNVRKYVWWLSVDNFKKKHNIRYYFKKLLNFKPYKLFTLINKIKSNKVNLNDHDDLINLYASYYAKEFLEKKYPNFKAYKLIEPISLFFLNQGMYLENINRKNEVLYNPKKNYEFTLQLIKYGEANGLKFKPLIGYNQQELLELYRHSKIYIDFGNFPGAERIPKEAVYNGCLILTGLNGASANQRDVPISNEYKIASNKENIAIIVDKIKSMIADYDKLVNAFEKYRQVVDELENEFVNCLNKIFGGVEK